jgi:hypothetical protein
VYAHSFIRTAYYARSHLQTYTHTNTYCSTTDRQLHHSISAAKSSIIYACIRNKNKKRVYYTTTAKTKVRKQTEYYNGHARRSLDGIVVDYGRGGLFIYSPSCPARGAIHRGPLCALYEGLSSSLACLLVNTCGVAAEQKFYYTRIYSAAPRDEMTPRTYTPQHARPVYKCTFVAVLT